mmetsp:Transcript_13157/g.36852  ORF Transcript_13157/g.36852 Transcript_13157/m.36852 type:complete len:685 (+) Transcript_13157:1081-3135(+)
MGRPAAPAGGPRGAAGRPAGPREADEARGPRGQQVPRRLPGVLLARRPPRGYRCGRGRGRAAAAGVPRAEGLPARPRGRVAGACAEPPRSAAQVPEGGPPRGRQAVAARARSRREGREGPPRRALLPQHLLAGRADALLPLRERPHRQGRDGVAAEARRRAVRDERHPVAGAGPLLARVPRAAHRRRHVHPGGLERPTRQEGAAVRPAHRGGEPARRADDPARAAVEPPEQAAGAAHARRARRGRRRGALPLHRGAALQRPQRDRQRRPLPAPAAGALGPRVRLLHRREGRGAGAAGRPRAGPAPGKQGGDHPTPRRGRRGTADLPVSVCECIRSGAPRRAAASWFPLLVHEPVRPAEDGHGRRGGGPQGRVWPAGAAVGGPGRPTRGAHGGGVLPVAASPLARQRRGRQGRGGGAGERGRPALRGAALPLAAGGAPARAGAVHVHLQLRHRRRRAAAGALGAAGLGQLLRHRVPLAALRARLASGEEPGGPLPAPPEGRVPRGRGAPERRPAAVAAGDAQGAGGCAGRRRPPPHQRRPPREDGGGHAAEVRRARRARRGLAAQGARRGSGADPRPGAPLRLPAGRLRRPAPRRPGRAGTRSHPAHHGAAHRSAGRRRRAGREGGRQGPRGGSQAGRPGGTEGAARPRPAASAGGPPRLREAAHGVPCALRRAADGGGAREDGQ